MRVGAVFGHAPRPPVSPSRVVDRLRAKRYASYVLFASKEDCMLLTRAAAPRMIADEASHGAKTDILIGIGRRAS